MKKIVYILTMIIIILSVNGCVMRDGRIERVSFNQSAIKTMEDVEKQRDALQNGKRSSISLLIDAYNNNKLSYEVRMASLEALAESKDPLVSPANGLNIVL